MTSAATSTRTEEPVTKREPAVAKIVELIGFLTWDGKMLREWQ